MPIKSKKNPIFFTSSAERDLKEIFYYIVEQDCLKRADSILKQIKNTIEKLEASPERGNYPTELSALGIREFRQIYCKPYRIIYRVFTDEVMVFLVADGRRDMQKLLERRLLN